MSGFQHSFRNLREPESKAHVKHSLLHIITRHTSMDTELSCTLKDHYAGVPHHISKDPRARSWGFKTENKEDKWAGNYAFGSTGPGEKEIQIFINKARESIDQEIVPTRIIGFVPLAEDPEEEGDIGLTHKWATAKTMEEETASLSENFKLIGKQGALLCTFAPGRFPILSNRYWDGTENCDTFNNPTRQAEHGTGIYVWENRLAAEKTPIRKTIKFDIKEWAGNTC